MRRTLLRRTAALALAAGSLAACSSDSSVAPEREQSPELVAALNEMSLPALAGLASTLSPVPTSALSAPFASGCSYAAAQQRFECPAVSANGLTLVQTFVLLDAAGAGQQAYSAATTDAVRTHGQLTGTLAASGGSLAVDQVQDLTLSGLLAGTHVLNGTSVAHVAATSASGTRAPFTSTSTTTINNLVLPRAASAQRDWPTSGTIALETTTTFGGPATPGFPVSALTTHALITFNGTSNVVVTFSEGGTPTERCTIDLAGNAAPKCS